MKITADMDRLRSAANGLRTLKEQLRTNMDGLEMLVLGLDGEWQGDAEKAYAGRIVYVRHEFTELERFLDEYAALLERFSQEYAEEEDALTSRIQLI